MHNYNISQLVVASSTAFPLYFLTDEEVLAYDDSPVLLSSLLIFFTGADRIPPLGFPGQLELQFLHGKNDRFATASTCDLILRLPTCHKTYKEFKEQMIWSITGNDGFGLT